MTVIDSDPWYELVVDDVLQQGDFVSGLSVFSPIDPGIMDVEQHVPVEDFERVVIISQSCDLDVSRDNQFAVVCPVFALTDRSSPVIANKDQWNAARAGRLIHYCALRRCDIEGYKHLELIVDLTRVIEAPIPRLASLCAVNAPRIRLRSPFREHLAQHFARKFMRVALEPELPKWEEIAVT